MKNDKLRNHWSRHATVYQIYPMSFQDSDRDGKGDLQGIIDRVDHLVDLGIGAVWICPFYKSPMADFGYDIEDYTMVDPTFGTMADFERLVATLHKHKIRVIVDFVGNHTSAQHPWFTESRSSRTNTKRDWYIWRDPKPDGGPPNTWVSIFGGPAWEYDKETNQYYLHSFLKEQPDLNWRNPNLRAAMMDVIDFWVKKGVDGFRIDALQHFLKNPAEPDPLKTLVPSAGLVDPDKLEIVGSFISDALTHHPDLFIVGEIYMEIEPLVGLYKLCPNGRFMPFNFSLFNLPWKASEFKRSIDTYQALLKHDYLANYTLGNHDISRVATRFGEAQALLAAFLQFTLPGMPFVYYGDEIGMTNGVVEPSAVRDILASIFRTQPPRDLERTPMQWDDSPHAGFSTDKPWLPVTPNYKTINVEHQKSDQKSPYRLYRALIHLRNSSETLRVGEYIPHKGGTRNIFSFERHLGSERLLVVANFSDGIEHVSIPSSSRAPHVVFSTNAHRGIHLTDRTLELMPYEGYIVRL